MIWGGVTMAETQILRPIGVDSYTLISGASQYYGTPNTGSNLYQNVDESSKNEADYNYGYLFVGQQVYDILYTLEEYTGSDSINKVTVKGYYFLYEFDSPIEHSQARFRINSGGTVYNDSYFNPSTSAYGLHSKVYTTNPKTSAAWTKAEVNALLAGDSLGAYVTGDKFPKTSRAHCCQYWVEVEYEDAPDPPTNVAASENDSEKVVVTWTKSDYATGYDVYRNLNITNADFELWTAGDSVAPNGWILIGTSSAVAKESTIKHGGSYSAKVTRNGTNCRLRSNSLVGSEGISQWRGKTVTWRMWVYATVDSRSRLRIYDGAGASYSSYHTGGSGWELLTVTRTIDAAATDIIATGELETGDTSAYFDDAEGEVLVAEVGDVASYNDTGAAAPVITPGSAVASDGTSSAHVALSLSGNSIANGTTYSYTVKATNAAGDSDASSADNGYRLAGSLNYQWQRSAADSDASYSNIAEGTTASYNDTDAPSDGSGRYYKCAISATGSTTVYSAVNRGYRALTYTHSPTDTAIISDNLSKTTYVYHISTVVISDVFSKVSTFARSILDTIVISESRLLSFTKTFIDNVKISGIVTKSFSKILVAVVAVSAVFSRVVSFIRTITDTTIISDSFSRVALYIRNILGTVTISDSLIKSFTKYCIERINISESYIKSFGKNVSSIVKVSESYLKVIGKNITEVVKIASSATQIVYVFIVHPVYEFLHTRWRDRFRKNPVSKGKEIE